MKTFIRTLIIGTALTAAPALAADAIIDIPAPPVAIPVVAPVFTWTGAYVGVQGGYSDFVADDNPVFGRDVDIDGYFGGVHAGYNFQFDNGTGNGLVLGAYADIDFGGLDIDLERRGRGTQVINGVGDIDFVARGMVKAGYGFGRVLGYAQGGVNYISGETSLSLQRTNVLVGAPGFRGGRDTDVDAFGYAVGGGVDFAVTDNVVVGGDYLYEDFGSGDGFGNDDAFNTANPLNLVNNREIDLDGHTFRAKLSYKF